MYYIGTYNIHMPYCNACRACGYFEEESADDLWCKDYRKRIIQKR